MRGFPRRGPKGATGPPSMHLPPYIYQLFQLKRVLEHKDKTWTRNYRRPVDGIAKYADKFEKSPPKQHKQEDDYVGVRKKVDLQKRKRTLKEKAEKEQLLEKKKEYNPNESSKMHPEKYTSNKYNTLFVARLNPATTESTLQTLFVEYGPIEKIFMIKTSEGKPRGYAFVEFKNEQDMTLAYRRANGVKVDGNRILVDVERGRTVKGWYPRRLGGGLGGEARRERRRRDRDDRGGRRGYSDGPGSRYGSRYGSDRYRGRDNHHDRNNYRGGRDRDRGRERDRGMDKDNRGYARRDSYRR